MNITIKPYDHNDKEQWNDFIQNSKTNHFMFNRNYMDYHADRFEDHSLMFFKDTKLIAVMPANLKDKILYSHQGLSFGGIIYLAKHKISEMLMMFDQLKEYCLTKHITKVIYKKIPTIYDMQASDEDAYALWYNNANMLKCEPNAIINLQAPISYSTIIKRGVKKGKTHNLLLKRNDDNYLDFYNNLTANLVKFNKKPVHSLEEFLLLSHRFPNNIELISVYEKNLMISASWVFKTDHVIHTQNIVSTPQGRTLSSGAFLFDSIIQNAKDQFSFFSFGISSENNGKYLNQPLISNKEYYGSVIQNIYTYELLIN